MDFESSDTSKRPPCLWREEPSCDEPQLALLAQEMAREMRPGAWVLLEGPMGAGKSTFARALMGGLGLRLPPEGSPTFAIAHEYSEPGSPRLVHLDLYRLEDEDELEAAGISAYFWEQDDAMVLSEWTSRWPRLRDAILEDPRHQRWQVELEPVDRGTRRRIRIYRV